jgi:hypothetical protein
VRIIFLSPSRDVTHFVRHGVLEIFIPEICSYVHEHDKRTVVFPVSFPLAVVYGQVSPLDADKRQAVVEKLSIQLLIPALQKLRRSPVFFANGAHTTNDCKQGEDGNGDVNV